jgi:muconolactone delta-isomerase
MTLFLVERYIPSLSEQELAADVARLGELPAGVRHLWTTLVSAEETCLSLFEAPDQETLEAAATRVRFPFDRIVEAAVL